MRPTPFSSDEAIRLVDGETAPLVTETATEAEEEATLQPADDEQPTENQTATAAEKAANEKKTNETPSEAKGMQQGDSSEVDV